MKKYSFLVLAVFSLSAMQSQNINDALRYSQDNTNGSARFRAMSGAFGAVGGDLSAMNINPAGSAIFAKSQVGVTLGNYNTSNKSTFFGTKTTESNVSFDLSQLGAVFVFNTNSDNSGWKKFALSINYDNTNNFDNSMYIAGNNTNNSVAEYFRSYANQIGLPGNFYASSYFDELSLRQRQAFIGYNTFIIDPAGSNPANNTFISNVPTGNYYQDYYIETTGYNGKLSLNASASYNDRFYFGINLNSHFIDYRQSTSFYEENSNTPFADRPSVSNITFNNFTQTYGNGFSVQLGAIAKITPSLRAGLAYDSPTWFELTDETWQMAYTNGSNFNGSNSAVSDSDIVIQYEPYNLRTPGKFTGSLAYVFGKSGLLSVDYSIKDYGNSRFRPSDDYFDPVNTSISNNLTMAGELRIGAEYRIKQWSLRGGFRHEDSPYENKTTVGDLTSFSGGFGYQFPRTRLDLAYTFAKRDTELPLFSQGLTDTSKNKAINNNLSLSVVFDLW